MSFMSSHSKHFMMIGVSVTGQSHSGRIQMISSVDDGGCLEAHRNDCLTQGNVNDVWEDIYMLISTFPEHRYVIRTCTFQWVNSGQCS